MATTNEVTLGYWAVRGRGAVVRELLAYCGIPFKNKLYHTGKQWFEGDKDKLGLNLPNLPYLIDGDKIFTESNAMLHYIPIKAGKRELLGDTDEKFIDVQIYFSFGLDIINEFNRIYFGVDNEKPEVKFAESISNGFLKKKLEIINKDMKGKEWQTGFLSIADFQLFEIVDLLHVIDASKLEPYEHLVSFRKRFMEIPQIKAHLESDQFLSNLDLDPNPEEKN